MTMKRDYKPRGAANKQLLNQILSQEVEAIAQFNTGPLARSQNKTNNKTNNKTQYFIKKNRLYLFISLLIFLSFIAAYLHHDLFSKSHSQTQVALNKPVSPTISIPLAIHAT